MPPALAYLWRIFQRLHRRRGNNGFGPDPVTWADIDAFARHSGVRLAPWEVEMIEDLDDLYRGEHARGQREQTNSGGKT